MNKKISTAERQRILDDFQRRHDGTFDKRLFLEEVRAAGEAHPAYHYFEWDDHVAGERYRLQQAEDFIRDLKVRFRYRKTTTVVRFSFAKREPTEPAEGEGEVEVPAAISPLKGRVNGGGFRLATSMPPGEYMAELNRQAAQALEQWLRRYRAVAISLRAEAEVETLIAKMRALVVAQADGECDAQSAPDGDRPSA